MQKQLGYASIQIAMDEHGRLLLDVERGDLGELPQRFPRLVRC